MTGEAEGARQGDTAEGEGGRVPVGSAQAGDPWHFSAMGWLAFSEGRIAERVVLFGAALPGFNPRTTNLVLPLLLGLGLSTLQGSSCVQRAAVWSGQCERRQPSLTGKAEPV